MLEWMKVLASRIRAWFSMGSVDKEFEQELEDHLRRLTEENISRGMAPEEARRAARLRLGGMAQLRETHRELRGLPFLETLWQDFRFALRMLGKNPGFAAVAVLTLALGIGANTTVFSWVREVLLNPLPGVGEPSRIVELESLTSSGEWVPTSYPDFTDFRQYVKLLESMSVAQPMSLAVGTDRDVEHMWGEAVSGNFFEVLKVRPAAGRFFEGAERDDNENSHAVAVISHALWKNRFHSNPSVGGTTLRVNQHVYTIVGVAPENFHGSMAGLSFDMWVPATMYGQLTATEGLLPDRKDRMFRVLGRLAPGVSIEQAREEVQAFAKRMAEAHTNTSLGMSGTLLPVWKAHYGVQDALRGPLSAGMCVGGVVLLIVCANLANLLLARATTRRKEFSIRIALGAARGRLARQVLTETLLLAAAGALAGLLLTGWLVGALRWLQPGVSHPALAQTPLDAGILAFTVGLAFSVALIAGLAPAMHAARQNVNEMLKEGGRSAAAGTHAQRFRGLLVLSEVALAVVALVGAGLFVKSFDTARTIRPGFAPEGVALGRFSLSTVGYDRTQTDSFCRRLREQLEREPGMTAVSYADSVPLGFEGGSWEDLKVEGYVPPVDENMKIYRNLVAPGFFRVMKIPVLEGRDFDLQDDREHEPVMIVTSEFVRRFLPNQTVIGRKVEGWGHWFTIVGVVGDIKVHQVTERLAPYFYVPIRQIFRPEYGVTFYVRTSGSVEQAMLAIRRESHALDPALPVFNTTSLSEFITASLFGQKIAANLLSVLAGIGLLLAAVGLYGVMAYSVAQRTNEIGIRMTLGAQRGDVLGMVVRQGLKYVLPGFVVGAFLAAVLARAASAALVAVSPADPGAYGFAAVFIILVTVGSTAIPAWRAMRVDPMVALRYE
jgi:predicted permease